MRVFRILGFFISVVFILTTTLSPLMAVENSSDKKLLEVTVRPLSELVVSAKNSAPASVISLNHTTLSAEITGRITSIKTETGKYVKKGQRLASLDCRSYELSAQQAKAGLKVARSQYDLAKKQYLRNQGLLRQGTIPKELFDQAEAGQKSALADIELKNVLIETANLAVSRCRINAPFSGQITQRMVQKGQLVTPGTPLFKLLQIDKLEVKASFSPAEVSQIKESPILEFVSGTERYKTVLRSIIQSVDETTRTLEVRLSLSSLRNELSGLAEGLSGRVEWTGKNALLPADFILRREGKLGVMYVVDARKNKGKARFHILADAREGQAATIELPADALIINQNRYRVNDGQAIAW